MRETLCWLPGYEPYHMDERLTQVRTGGWRGEVYTLRYEAGVAQRVMRLLDGQRSREELLAALPPEAREAGAQILDDLCQSGLVVRRPALDLGGGSDALSHYLTALSLSPAALCKLRQARVLLVGAGVLGSRIATGLAQLGIAAITVMDDRRIDEADRRSHLLYAQARVGVRRALFWQRWVTHHWPGTTCRRAALPPRRLKSLVDLVSQHALVICAEDRPAPGMCDALNLACLQSHTPWVQLTSDSLLAIVGPLFIPGETGCMRCWEQQRAAGLTRDQRRDLEQLRRHQSRDVERAFIGSPGLADLTAGLLLADLPFVLGCAGSRLAGRYIVVDFLTQEMNLYECRKMPRCPACGLAAP